MQIAPLFYYTIPFILVSIQILNNNLYAVINEDSDI